MMPTGSDKAPMGTTFGYLQKLDPSGPNLMQPQATRTD
jgi:hypothetical protein